MLESRFPFFETKELLGIVKGALFLAFLLFLAVRFVAKWRQQRKDPAAAKRQKARRVRGESPMPRGRYDFWRGEESLLDPAPTSLDSALTELVRRFAKSDDELRARMRAAISEDESRTLKTYSGRAAVFALREKNAEWLVDGITAIAMLEEERADGRDIVLYLGLLAYSAARVGADAEQLARSAAALSEDEVARLITGYMKYRDPQEAWGFLEVETEHGAGFVGWRFHDYRPRYDLTRIAIELGRFISGDKYQLDSIDVAEAFHRVWLEGAGDDKSLDAVLKAVRAGATIHADLRPEQHRSYKDQLLMLFLLEVESESAAQELLGFARRKGPQRYGSIAVAEGRVFCLIIGRSGRLHRKPFETSSSLARLVGPITEILKRHV